MQDYCLLRILLFIGSILQSVYSKTNSEDVSALNVMFKSLNSPSKLSGWQSNGGDPCDDSWEGINCKGSAVIEIKLSDYGLNGQLGYQLSSLKSVTSFDMSKNNFDGDIPYQLPPNLVYLYLSENNFTGNVPYSISEMKNLKELDLSHNRLSGQLSEIFSKLSKLTTMDMSSNRLTGNLPQSLANLTSLTNLYLQNNQFTGSINPVRDLPLNELNVKNNKFTGWIPNEVKGINSLETGGNSWSTGAAPPPPPGVHHRHGAAAANNQEVGSVKHGVIIAASCVGALVVVVIMIGLFSRKKQSPSSHYFEDEGDEGKAFSHQKDSKSGDYATVDIKSLQKAPSKGLKASLSSCVSFRDNEFANRLQEKRSTSIRSVPYALVDLQNATSNFADGRLIGEGSIGRVYKAKYGDGKVLAVKKIESSLFQGSPPEEVSGVVASISKLHHPNIADLVGYCSDKGNVMLVYEHFRNGSLHEFLHMSDDFSKPLTWNTRIRIALGTARAVEYLHEGCSPPLLHKNIKSSNILLDLELNPRLSDHGLAKFHQRTSQNLGAGYNAPECVNPSAAYTQKSDVYSFGVVMLELLTGRKPLDSKRPKSEECLVRWATPQLHDIDALQKMVDPALRGLYPPKSLSRFADLIGLCVKVEPEFRPPMSEVVQLLERLVQQANLEMKEDLSASCRTEDSDAYCRV